MNQKTLPNLAHGKHLSETMSAPPCSRLSSALVLVVCLLVCAGCHVARQTAALPTEMVTAVVRGPQPSQPDPGVLQSDLLRYADGFFVRTSAGIEDYANQVNTPEAREQALKWKLALGTSAVGIATGANPTANLIDFLSLATLTRAFLEEEALRIQPSGSMDLWLENARVLETNAWSTAQGILSATQQEEFRVAVSQWLAQNGGMRWGFFSRPQELAIGLSRAKARRSQPGSLFSLIGLDATAALDPAVREVTRTRLFAERALFSMERMPFLLRWQTELLAAQLLRQQEITNALAAAERLSLAAESASQTAALLPDRVSAERKAILDALETQEGKLKSLSAEVTQTLQAGEKMSTSLNATVASFDSLMKRFGVGEPGSSPGDTNSPPFNILDYARTAEEVANMAQQLDALFKSTGTTLDAPALDKRIAQLGTLSAQAREDAKSVLNHAFLLCVAFAVVVFGCALIYRKLAKARVPARIETPSVERSRAIGPTSM